MSTKPHFSLLATSFAGGPRPRVAATILFGLWFALFFAALFSPPILDDADGTHAQAAQAIAQHGDLVTLHVDGVRYLEKAPLPYWLAAVSFRLFGFNTFAAHLPQALAVLLLMLLGHRWANQAFGARTGFYTALAILTSAGVFLFTRILIPEVLLSLFLSAALFAFLKSLGPISTPSPSPRATPLRAPFIAPLSQAMSGSTPTDQSPRAPFIAPLSQAMSASTPTLPPKPTQNPTHPTEQPSIAWYAGPLFYPAVLWSSLAFAVLTKGLVALIFFFATAALFLILTDTLRDLRKTKPLAGLLLFLAIAAPWHILAALRNPEIPGHHGFLWFYFWNEHVLRFVGRRIPRDYNKLPGYLYWALHLVWLFPWTLFLPLGFAALWRRFRHQSFTLTRNSNLLPPVKIQLALIVFGGTWMILNHGDIASLAIVITTIYAILIVISHRLSTGFTPSPFHRIDPQQRSILLLALFSAIVLLFFSLSTNQEYYTFPAYLPILLLIAATLTRAEQTFSSDPAARRWITFAHAAFTIAGAAIAIALFYGLWNSRHLAFVPNIGSLLAHRGVGDYTLSMSHLFDLTTESFAALRLPAILAALAFTFGPALAWMLRAQRRHLSATTALAFTSAAFLLAAQLAFARFAPMLSSADFAAKVQSLERSGQLAPNTPILLFGDQSYGSSIPFYLGRPVQLVDSRSSSMLFGSTFPEATPIFLTPADLRAAWGSGPRKLLFVPLERRDDADHLLGPHQTILYESAGKALLTDRPLPP